MYDKPERKKLLVDSGQPTTSTAKPKRFGKNLFIIFILHKDVYFFLS